MLLDVPATEPIAVVTAAKAIEPAMLKGLFPASYQPVMVTTAFFKSLPAIVLPVTALPAIVLPVTALPAIVLPVTALPAIVLPAVAVMVAPSSVLSEGA